MKFCVRGREEALNYARSCDRSCLRVGFFRPRKTLPLDPIGGIVKQLELDIIRPRERGIRTMAQEPSLGFRKRAWLWLRSQVIRDVPDGDSLCEYDCRKQECGQEEWAHCDRRLNKAAGELRPGKQSRIGKPREAGC